MNEVNNLNLTAEDNYKTGLELYKSERYQEAFARFELVYLQPRENNSDDSPLSLGDLYENEQAFKEASQGNGAAQVCVGYLYANALGVEEDLQEAEKYFKLAADQGNRAAFIELGHLYQWILENDKEAEKYLKLAADTGDIDDLITLADFYSPPENIEYYKLAADLDPAYKNAYALMQLGKFYGFENPTEAAKYYKLAADVGNTDALIELGFLYKRENWDRRDIKEAEKYFKLAADQGHADAESCLSDLYCFHTEDIVQGYTKAEKYCKLEADTNCRYGSNWLNELYKKLSDKLYIAIYRNDLKAIEKLLTTGMPISGIRIEANQTLLHEAVKGNNPEVVKLLLCYGADVDALDEGGQTPRDLNPECFDQAWMLIHKANIENVFLFLEFSIQANMNEDVTKVILFKMTGIALQTQSTYLFLTDQAQMSQDKCRASQPDIMSILRTSLSSFLALNVNPEADINANRIHNNLKPISKK